MFRALDRLLVGQLARLGWRRHVAETAAGQMHALSTPGRGILPPVALLHGLSSAGYHHISLVRCLRPHVRALYTPDLPGHGLSDAPPPGVSNRDAIEAVCGFFDALFTEPVVLFANSMGGVPAVHFARRHPEKVLGLMLCSPGGAPLTQGELSGLVRTLNIDSLDSALSFVDRVFPAPGPLRRPMALAIRARFSDPLLRRFVREINPEDLLEPDDVAGIEMPCLVIWGREDQLLPDACRLFFREHLPAGARVERPADMGHAPVIDAPDAVADRLLQFIGKLTREGALQAP